MSRLTAPLDVLAVMDAVCCVLAIDRTADPNKQLEQVRVAVAELIEADKEYDAAYLSGNAYRMADATNRRRTALARVGGAA